MTHAHGRSTGLPISRAAMAGAATALALLLAGTALAQPAGGGRVGGQTQPPAGQELPVDDTSVEQAPAPNARRIYVSDPAHFAVLTQLFTIDGDKGKLLGMSDTGFVPNTVVASDGSFFGTASTVWSRLGHGKRTDYIEILDARTHNPIIDIELPKDPRFLVGTYPMMTTLTPDNKSLLFYQFSPSPAVGLVSLTDKKLVKMMDVPDCYHIFPSDNNNFFMHCRDGSMLKVTFKADGTAERKKTQVFHKEDEYLYNTPAYSAKAGRIVWPTYTGKTFQVDVTGNEAKFMPAFEAFSDEEKAQGWAPGGWQVVAYHRESDRVFLLADQRAKWTHKSPSRFVFVFEGKTGKRLNKIDLGHETDSIAVSQDKTPQLYALSSVQKTLFIHDAESGKETSKVDRLGHSPLVINTSDM